MSGPSALARRAGLRIAGAAFGVVVAAVASLTGEPDAAAEGLTMDQAVSVAFQRNRDVIAAQLEIEAAQLDKVAAGIYPNPIFSYTVGNIVLGAGNTQGTSPPTSPGPFSQLVQTFAVYELVDIWNKRGARVRAAGRNVEYKKLLVEDILREIAHSVRSSAVEVAREQREYELAREMSARYGETVRITQARQKAGEISDAELKKIELEGMRYQNTALGQELELYVARERLASLLALEPAAANGLVVDDGALARPELSLPGLTQRALEERPDMRAVRQAHVLADAELASARREVLPDVSLGVAYTHSGFTIAGDNLNALALNVSLPLPLFDRNQAGIGRAQLDGKRAENDAVRLKLRVEHEVAEAVRRAQKARTLVEVFEGGMIERAETALRVAERSYKAGAVSLLELLESQRTYIQTRADYLEALHAYRQAVVDVMHAVGGGLKR